MLKDVVQVCTDGSDRSQSGHRRFELGDFRIALGLFPGLLGIFERFLCLSFIKVFAADSGVGKNRHAIGLNLKDAAGNENIFLFALIRLHAYGARTDAGNERNVAGQNTEFTFLTGKRHKRRFAGEDAFFCADDVNKKRCHKLLRLIGFEITLKPEPNDPIRFRF